MRRQCENELVSSEVKSTTVRMQNECNTDTLPPLSTKLSMFSTRTFIYNVSCRNDCTGYSNGANLLHPRAVKHATRTVLPKIQNGDVPICLCSHHCVEPGNIHESRSGANSTLFSKSTLKLQGSPQSSSG